MSYRPVLLAILDGWGINPKEKRECDSSRKNPEHHPVHPSLPHAKLLCSGEAVGLPPGTMGKLGSGPPKHRGEEGLSPGHYAGLGDDETEAFSESALLAQQRTAKSIIPLST